MLKVRRDSLGDIVENAHDAEHRRWIDAFAAGLVIQRDVAAGDGRAQSDAGLADAVDGRRKLGHDLGLFRIAEVETIGRSHRLCARAGYLARGFGHSVFCAQIWIEIGPASVAIESHGQAALMACRACALDAHDTRFATRPPWTVLVCTMVSYCS